MSSGLPPRIRRLFRIDRLLRASPTRELDEELTFHFETTVEALMSQGMDRGSAEREAHRRFGDRRRWRKELERVARRTVRRRRIADWLDRRHEDVRHGVRGLSRSPAFTAGIVLTFALGLGANATMFGILDRLFLSPPAHIQEPEAVRRLLVDRYVSFMGERTTDATVTYPDYDDLKAARAFEALGAYSLTTLTLGRGEEARRVDAVMATASFIRLLGVRPALGRFFTEEEDSVGAPGVAVIGHGYWLREFGGDADVVGSTLDFGRGPYTIIGVAPRGFTGIDLEPVDVWLPLHTAQGEGGEGWRTARGWYWLRVAGRLAPGATPSSAEAEATTLHRAARSEVVDDGDYDPEARVVAAPLLLARGPLAGGEAKVAAWLGGVSVIVLLVACANVANLLLARSLRRRREIAIRLALGISRLRLLGQTLTEALLLAALAGAAAILVAGLGGEMVRRVLLPDVGWPDSPTGPRVLAFVAAAALATGLASGLLPAIQAGRERVRDAFTARSSGVTEGAAARGILSVAQIAFSVVLLVGAGLFVRSLERVRSLDMGFDADALLLVRVVGAPRGEAGAIYERLESRLGSLPMVESVTASGGLPFWSSRSVDLRLPGRDSLPSHPAGGPYIILGGAGYFQTMGLAIRRGRGFTRADDVPNAEPVVVVNEAMAKGIWPGEDPLGECLLVGGPEEPCSRVVGVVENARRQAIVEDANWLYYFPQKQWGAPDGLLVRARGEPAAAVGALRRQVVAAEPGIRYADVRPLMELVQPQARSWELGAFLFTLFGLLAVTVAGIGLYSVLAFEVAQRTREIGIRSALGATQHRITALVLRRGLAATVMGLALGGAVAWALAPSVEDLLFQTPARDVWTFGAVAAGLALVALTASVLPAMRAVRVDPLEALRAE